MEDLSIYLFWTGLLLAGLATIFYAVYAASGAVAIRRFAAETGAGTVSVSVPSSGPNPGLGRLATTFAAFTALALAGAIAARWAAIGHTPLSNMYEFTVAFAFGIIVAYLGFETTTGLRRMGVVALPMVAAMLGIATLFPSEVVPLIPALQNARLLTIHVTCMMASYAVLTVAFAGAAVYLAQGGEGGRRIAWLPSANAAGDLAHRATMVGFPLLGLGIALGAWWANDAWGRYWGWDPKETSALVTWLIYAGYLHARGLRRWRGKRAAGILVLGYVGVLFTYFAVNLWV
ncbi:MAG: cytochrome c biogenesis protein CcsA, partial [Anaerolineales bacterium]